MGYRMDYPAVDGRPVQQGHAEACRKHGHAAHVVDGIDQGFCPRCGDSTVAKSVRTQGTKVIVTAGYYEGLTGTVASTWGAVSPTVTVETDSGNRLHFDSTDLDVIK
jgi:hypothetical protein